MTYVELHAHSAYSFLDGASQPAELAVRAAELGYEALALTDHDGVYGSLEFAHAAKPLGGGPITGAGRRRAAQAEPPPTPARAPLPPALDVERLLEHRGGLVCLSGCARHGLGVRD